MPCHKTLGFLQNLHACKGLYLSNVSMEKLLWQGFYVCLKSHFLYSYYTTQSVMVAAGITTAVCLAISLFAIQTKVMSLACFFKRYFFSYLILKMIDIYYITDLCLLFNKACINFLIFYTI